MKNYLTTENIHYSLALLISFSLPLGILTPVFISLFFVNWIAGGDFKNKFKAIISNPFSMLFISFYLLHVFGLLYTKNMNDGLFDLQVKLSILIFPVILASKPFTAEQNKRIINVFILGCIVSCVLMFSYAFYKSFFIEFNIDNFFYTRFTINFHPSYISMYLNFASVFLLIKIINGDFMQNKLLNIVSIFAVILFSVSIILLSSKMGIITFFMVFIVLSLYLIFFLKKIARGLLMILVLFSAIFIITHFASPILNRINNALNAMSENKIDNKEKESTAIRLLIWNVSGDIIKNNLIFGTGTGDVGETLVNEYTKRGIDDASKKRLNAHNEFYQTTLRLGLIGLLLLLANLLVPLFSALKNKNFLYTAFLLIITFNFIPESILSTQAGVMFYAFFNSLLCFNQKLTT